ncbi:tetratricopeptide repeat protein [Flavobacterium sp. BFFFF1]|uniref:tetratricopeptide repeat protein n=1 Tax=Flavobacterium sp. BFFFF1 TaxID=2015557 RepID=UPI0025C12835|nr:tetratricopeptide repeat protein [Flavobacterium sp. BFFFF1]
MKNTNYIVLFFLLKSLTGFGQSAVTTIDSLKRVLAVSKTDTVKVNILNSIADQYKESYPDSTAVYALKAATLSRKANYEFGLATSYINSGNGNIILGNYKEAKDYFVKAQTVFEKLLNSDSEIDRKRIKNGLGRSFASQGVIFSQQSNYYMALEMYQKALKRYLETGQKTNISKTYNNIGVVYKSQQNNAKALEYFKKAFVIQEEIGELNAPVTLTNIGVIYAESGNKKQAFQYYQKAERLFEKIDNNRGSALLKNYFGDFYKSEKNYPKALEYYNASFAMYEAIQNKFGASLALYNLGLLNQELKKYDEAITFASKSLAYAKEIDVLDQTYHSEKLLSELYSLKNNAELAFFHYKNYIVARDSITNQENTKKMLRSEMESEYKRKAAVLSEETKRANQLTIFSIIGVFLLAGLIFVTYNRRQIKRRLTLQKEVAEYEQKALHLQMNPHFVFNCLGSISSFIVQNGTDSALKYLSKFSKLMRLTLEYSKGSLIPIDKEIESLQNYLELEQLRFHSKFEFSIHSSDKVEFNMGIPPLLIQPFVENAILHGMVPKEGNGKIDVGFDVQDGQFICSIADDGIGFSKSKHLKEDSVTAHKSMALEITKKRLEIMEATTLKSAKIDIQELIENNEIIGTKVILRLPIQYIS